MSNKCKLARKSILFLLIPMMIMMFSGLKLSSSVRAAETEPYGLEAMCRFDTLPYLKLNTVTGGQSSFDRTGGNRDNNSYLYSDGSEKVMLDQLGPGCVYRIWVTGVAATDAIKIYFDGEKTPRVDMLLTEFFSGKKDAFLAPLVVNDNVSSGGFICYLPLPYSKSIKITTNAIGKPCFFYNIEYQSYSQDTPIVTWTGKEDSLVAREMWSNAGKEPRSDSGNTIANGTLNLVAGDAQTLLNVAGPSSISSIKLHIPGIDAQPQKVTDDGRSYKGYSQFVTTINPNNQGVVLERRFDFSIGNQTADVYVDGYKVGTWYNPGSNSTNYWKDSSFSIPQSFTEGKNAITVKIQFLDSNVDWNEFYYWICSKVNGVDLQTDELDVGNADSETKHNYVVDTAIWEGSRTFIYPPTQSIIDTLNDTLIRIYWDNEVKPSVEAPLGLFFAFGQFGNARNVRALPVGIDDNSNMYVYFPMPFAANARIELVNQGLADIKDITYEIKHKPFKDSFTNVGYFKTAVNHKNLVAKDGKDMVALDTDGSGKLLGVVQSTTATLTRWDNLARWYLEGDERIYIDGSQTPVIQGTGTEDFYNAGWYFNRGPFSLQMHGYTANFASANTDSTAAYRLYLHDAIPFKNHIRFSIEHGTNNDSSEDMWTLAYYYHKPGVSSTLTDTLDVGDPDSESSHSYTIHDEQWNGIRTYTYEGEFQNRGIADNGRALKGYSQFNMAINPDNQGVILRRTFDQGVQNQMADVYADGSKVGTWYKAGGNPFHSWRDDDFIIPASFTRGKNSITIKIQFVSSVIDWNEFKYKIYCICEPDMIVADNGQSYAEEDNIQKIEKINSQPNMDIGSKDIKIMVNGVLQHFDQPSVLENGRVLVPMRGIFETLGASVSWDNSTETVTAVKSNITIKLKINDVNVLVNDQNWILDHPAKLINNRTMIPVRFQSEILGAKVEWDDETQTVKIFI